MTPLPVDPLFRAAVMPLRQLGRVLAHGRWWLAHQTQPAGGGHDDAQDDAESRQPASVRVQPDDS